MLHLYVEFSSHNLSYLLLCVYEPSLLHCCCRYNACNQKQNGQDQHPINEERIKDQIMNISNWISKYKMSSEDVLNRWEFKSTLGLWLQEYCKGVDREQRAFLAICGYLRDMNNDGYDYDFIFGIILLFLCQKFAKYYDESIDKDYKQKMKFGDILKTEEGKYLVLDKENEMREVGDYDYEQEFENGTPHELITISIPFSICKHLERAVSFYSKFDKFRAFHRAYKYDLILEIRHDDEWIVENLGGVSNSCSNKIVKFCQCEFMRVERIGLS